MKVTLRYATAIHLLTLPLTFVLFAHGATVYDGFDYAEGPLSSAEGGTGWSGPWAGDADVVAGSFGTANPGGLKLLIAGNRLRTMGGGAHRIFRSLSESYDSGVVWLSFTAKVESAGTGYAGLSLYDGQTEKLFIGQTFHKTTWGVERRGSQKGAKSTKAPVSSEPAFLACRLNLGSADQTPDIQVWINPDPGEQNEPDPGTEDLDLQLVPFRFNRIRIGSGNETSDRFEVDEIRIGRSYAEAAPLQTANDAEPALSATILTNKPSKRVNTSLIGAANPPAAQASASTAQGANSYLYVAAASIALLCIPLIILLPKWFSKQSS